MGANTMGKIRHPAFRQKDRLDCNCDEEFDWGMLAKVAFGTLAFLVVTALTAMILWGLVSMASDSDTPEERKEKVALQRSKDIAKRDDKIRFMKHCESQGMWANNINGLESDWECKKK